MSPGFDLYGRICRKLNKILLDKVNKYRSFYRAYTPLQKVLINDEGSLQQQNCAILKAI